jgi:predicted MFS family arabinose efflux permease
VAVQACGALIGFLIGAYLADAIGRKWTFMISAVATIIMVLVHLYVPIGDTGPAHNGTADVAGRRSLARQRGPKPALA